MKLADVYRVRWGINDRGTAYKTVYIEDEDLAHAAALEPWGFCGSQGDVVKTYIKIAENIEEVTQLLISQDSDI